MLEIIGFIVVLLFTLYITFASVGLFYIYQGLTGRIPWRCYVLFLVAIVFWFVVFHSFPFEISLKIS